MTNFTTLSPTGNLLADGDLSGVKWSSPNLTYSFPDQASDYEASIFEKSSFQQINLQMQTQARSILGMYSAVSGLVFSELTANQGDATIRLGFSDAPGTAYAYYPDSSPSGGDIWFSHNYGDAYASPIKGNYAWHTMIHEFGHAVGLKHGHEVTGAFGALPTAYDSNEYSVMTYRSYVGGPASFTHEEEFGFPQSLMMADIIALQSMYGANYTTNSGNSIYSFNAATGEMSINGVGQGVAGANRIFLTIWDGGGNDTYDFSNYADDSSINLGDGSYSLFSAAQQAKLDAYDGTNTMARGNVFNALMFGGDIRSLIENAVGGRGNDRITGNQVSNDLFGNGGNDVLVGLAGNDRLYGGSGADRFDPGAGMDTMDGGDGSDTVDYGLESLALAVTLKGALQTGVKIGTVANADILLNIENIIGGSGADKLNGDQLSNTFSGNGGNDTLKGGAGNDTLNGDAGADKLYGEDDSDKLYGGAGNDKLYGGNGDDVIYGGDGDDLITGGGNHDDLYGGAGKDTFVFLAAGESPPPANSAGDRIFDFDALDVISLKAIDAQGTIVGDQAFAFIGTASFAVQALGQVRYLVQSGSSFVQIENTGDGLMDLEIKLVGYTTALTTADFIL
jgi:serralysin